MTTAWTCPTCGTVNHLPDDVDAAADIRCANGHAEAAFAKGDAESIDATGAWSKAQEAP